MPTAVDGDRLHASRRSRSHRDRPSRQRSRRGRERDLVEAGLRRTRRLRDETATNPIASSARSCIGCCSAKVWPADVSDDVDRRAAWLARARRGVDRGRRSRGAHRPRGGGVPRVLDASGACARSISRAPPSMRSRSRSRSDDRVVRGTIDCLVREARRRDHRAGVQDRPAAARTSTRRPICTGRPRTRSFLIAESLHNFSMPPRSAVS